MKVRLLPPGGGHFFKVNPTPDTKIAGITKRWTPELIRARGFTPISNYFLESYSTLRPAITMREAMFIVHLMSFKWDEKNPFPSFTKLSSQMGISLSAARAYGRSLEKKGYINRERREGATTVFDLQPLFDRLEARLATATYIEPRLQRPTGKTRIFGQEEGDGIAF